MWYATRATVRLLDVLFPSVYAKPELKDWIVEALYVSGMDATPEAIRPLERIALRETGGNPDFTHPYGASGLFALRPDTWAHFNQGGDIYDPISNGVAAIAYLLHRHGALVDFPPIGGRY